MRNIGKDTPLVKAALVYANLGWRVIPLHSVTGEGTCSCGKPDCQSSGKHPRIKGWRQKASTNPYLIKFWWARDPEANIGIVLGDDGLTVIDFDVAGEYRRWCDLHPEWAKTLTARTGGGGYHVYLRVPGPIGTYLHSGGEVRSSGAYVVAPPSRHVAGCYEWVNPEAVVCSVTPEDLPSRQSPVVPTALVLFTEDGASQPDLSQWSLSERILRLIAEPLPVGQRSEADMAVIVALVAAGASDDEIRSVFRHYPIGVGGKYADKGEYADQYLAHSIGKARGFVKDREPVWLKEGIT